MITLTIDKINLSINRPPERRNHRLAAIDVNVENVIILRLPRLVKRGHSRRGGDAAGCHHLLAIYYKSMKSSRVIAQPRVVVGEREQKKKETQNRHRASVVYDEHRAIVKFDR